ncbi:cupin domain-containing protein [Xenorhabdus bovienii]|uniref:cupin domain-containing protein n=1 Tax=Xenorhabdus bovienii TaxID=40576 RepID=UPI001EDE346F|nr:cupin domain-containing protein [Xenorhabdus bovienii]MCG3462611.1 cupin domain-containing protein [Xenorhabdus bovienii]
MEVEDFDQLFALSQHTSLSASEYIAAHHRENAAQNELVTITRKDRLYTRIKGDALRGGYHYRHVLTTTLDPDLLVLRTTPLSTRHQARPNTGHQVKEIVYVLSGRVGIVWQNTGGNERHSNLGSGDSVYIDSWVPHAFYAIEPESQILAVDYL